MAKPEWGTKRTCHSCGVRFYDLMHSPIICPHCQSLVEPDLPFKMRRGSTTALPEPVKAIAPVSDPDALDIDDVILPEDDDDVLTESDDEADSALIEDASDLGEDNDDMAEVTGHLDEKLDDV